jgi:5'-methylthioadenosine phosphorylase
MASGKDLGLKVHETATYVCIQGPRFSTRAESKLFRQWEANIIGMTLYPECILARELQLCYASVAMITDYDVWAEKPVSATEIRETMNKNVENFKKLILDSLPRVQKARSCTCAHSLEDALL